LVVANGRRLAKNRKDGGRRVAVGQAKKGCGVAGNAVSRVLGAVEVVGELGICGVGAWFGTNEAVRRVESGEFAAAGNPIGILE